MQKLVLLFGAVLLIMSACNEKCENEFGECPEDQLAKDIETIENYLEENNLTAVRHASELFYIIEEEGTGEFPENGQQVAVNYVGRFLDGKVFDTSIESVAREEAIFNENRAYQPFEFQLGRGSVISGWDIGIKLMKEGGKSTLIIPSFLAYGPRGSGTIPANTVLLFEVELVDIKF